MENKDYKAYIPLLTRIIIVIAIILGIYFFSKTILIYLLPFILAWIIASVLQPLIRFLSSTCKIPRNISTFIAVVLFVLLSALFLAMIGSIIFIQLTKLSDMLPTYSNKFYYQSTYFVRHIQEYFVQLPPDIAQALINGLHAFSNSLTDILGYIVTSILSFVTAIPRIFVFIIATMISTYFMARDRRKILRFFALQLPSKTVAKGRVIRHDLILALMGYIRAQFILMSITFVESIVGLTIIGIDYAVLIALAASLIDALPILGTGFIYVPLIIWNTLLGNYKIAILVGILYGIILFVRQLLEPRILSSQIGLYPLVTLISMYVGLNILGILGLILGPICVIILITLQKIEVLPNWRK